MERGTSRKEEKKEEREQGRKEQRKWGRKEQWKALTDAPHPDQGGRSRIMITHTVALFFTHRPVFSIFSGIQSRLGLHVAMHECILADGDR